MNEPIALESLTCSFCEKEAGQCKVLISGNNAFICDECIPKAAQVLHDRLADMNIDA